MTGHLARALSDRELRFIEEYCVDLAPRGAALRSGSAASSASAWGNEMLRRPEIKHEIDIRLQELSAQSIVSSEWVRRQLKTVVERCMQQQPVMVAKRGADGKMEMVESGEYKFDSNGANKALESLGKHLGMFKDTTVITIESELKDMTPEQLENKRQSLLEEHQVLDLAMTAAGVYEAATPAPPAPEAEGEHE